MRIRFCPDCGEYTLGSKCPRNHVTVSKSRKFKINDKHFHFRIGEIKKHFKGRACLTSKNLRKLI